MRSVVPIGSQRRGATTAFIAAAVTLFVILAGLIAVPGTAYADTAPVEANTPETVSSDALPTAQINGIVWSQVVVGNTVYAGGSFSTARPAGAAAGSGEVTRSNLLAYDIRTGDLLGFAPTVDGQVLSLAASPDGTRVYIGGDFTNVNGVKRNRIAAFDVASGNLVSSFAPSANASVRGVVATNSVVYFTGVFGRVSDNDRARIAAVTTSGALLPFAPTLNGGRGNDVVVSPDGSSLVAAGAFTTANGSNNPGYGLARFDTTTGALQPLPLNAAVRNGGADASIYSLSSSGNSFYGTGYTFGSGGNLEGSFRADWSTGALTWVQDCHGDSYDSYAVNGVVYVASHSHYCGSIVGGFPQSNPWTFYRGTAFTDAVERITPTGLNLGYFEWGGKPAPKMLHFFPQFNTGDVSGASQAAWSVTGNGDYVVYGGEFTRVNNQPQQGLVRFATKALAPNTDGPRLGQSSWTPTAQAVAATAIRISWPLNWDRDNENLTYQVIRNGQTNAPIHTVTARSKPADWLLPGLAFTDRNVVAGQSYTYRIRVLDAFNNVQNSATITAVADGAGASSAYANAVVADSPISYWPLGDTAGSVSYDWTGTNDLTVNSPVTRGVAGALVGEAATAARFPGTSNGFAVSKTRTDAPQTFGVEAWFKTTTTSGGKIVGFGNKNTGTSGSYDRHVYMAANGTLNFGVHQGSQKIISSTQRYNDGQWHHVAAGMGPEGMTLYVDGVRVGARTDVTSAGAYLGYWRIGGDTAWSGSTWFRGDIDEVAVYRAPLTGDQAKSHFDIGSGTNRAPTAAFTSGVTGLTATVDGSTSTDPDGTIATYGWNWGDGTADTVGASATASHAYAASGTYTVTLTVTDNKGATATKTGTVTVEAPNVAPTAAFTNATTGVSVSVDGSTSTDSDGTIASYRWNWDDGTADTVGASATASHSYAASGTYTVTLTVTDNKGATATKTANVTIVAPNVAPTAAFTSSVSGLSVSVNGAGSSDADGSIASYSWNWGDDSAAGSGATASHTYVEAGTYTVKLTVTDDKGATGEVTAQVEVTAPPVATELAVDAFERSVTGGWGSATTGGAWSLSGTASHFSVAGGNGVISTTAGLTRTAYLNGVSSTATDLTSAFSVDALPAGGSNFVSFIGRRVGSSDYQARLSLSAAGAVQVQLRAGSTTIGSANVAGLTLAAGDSVNVRVQVFGTNPTTIRAKVWKAGTTEPTAWSASTTDSTAGLQAAGGVGLGLYVGSGVAGTQVVRFSDLTAVPVP